MSLAARSRNDRRTTQGVIDISALGPRSKAWTLRLGPVAVCLAIAEVAALKRYVVPDEHADPPGLSPMTPQEQYEADRAVYGR